MLKERYSKIIFFLICILTMVLFLSTLTLSADNFYKNKTYNQIMKNIKDYNVYETFYTNIYFSEKDREYVDTVANCIDFYAPLIFKDFSIIDAPVIDIVIYENGERMTEALLIDYETAPMGAYYGGIINILSPGQWIDAGAEAHIRERFVKEGPLIHELTHFVTAIKDGGNCPVWISEGIALYYEHKYAAFEWRKDLKKASADISIKDLENSFRNINEAKAYRRSFDIISDYIERYGESSLHKALAAGMTKDIFE